MTLLVTHLFSLLSSFGLASATVAAPAKPANTKEIVVIGDSITQGYGVKEAEAYPGLVEHILNMRGYRVKVLNGGVSGSTSDDADARVRWYLRSHPQIIVLALGENDALKGADPARIKANLARAIDLAQKANDGQHIQVALVEVKIFSNFGADYAQKLKTAFESLAKEKHVPLLPFLLEDVALHKDLMQADGKHPNARGQVIVAKAMADRLKAFLGAPTDAPTLDGLADAPARHEAQP